MNHLQFITKHIASAVVRGSGAPTDRCHSRAKDSLLLTDWGKIAWEREKMLGKPGKAWENPYMNSTCHQECGYE